MPLLEFSIMFSISHSWGVPQQRSPAPMNKMYMICATSQFHCQAVARHPPNRHRPWKLIIGCDEFIAGNALAPDNRRKTMVLSFSFVELGQVALSCGSAWMIPVVMRTSTINQVDGGMSNVMRVFLRRLLLGPEGLATVGVPLLINGQHTMLFASVAAMLADGDGHRQVWNWRGAGSLKPCFVHFNTWKKDQGEMACINLICIPRSLLHTMCEHSDRVLVFRLAFRFYVDLPCNRNVMCVCVCERSSSPL
jgi:hypothetical protein